MREHDEEILEALWTAAEEGRPTLEAVRERCVDSFTGGDLDRLERAGLIRREGDELLLSGEGSGRARDVVRRHRLAEALLYVALDVEPERRAEVACEVEHTLVRELADGICTLLGHPRECPDGKPIPPGLCCEAHRQVVSSLVTSLADLEPGTRARILYIKPKHHERLHRLTSFGLTPGVELELHQRTPAYCIAYEGTELALDRDVASDIFVSPIEPEEGGEKGGRRHRGRGRGRGRGQGRGRRRGWWRRGAS